MSLFDHVAMAIDFSEPSRVALTACYRLAELAGAKRVTVMHAVQEVVLPAGDQPAVKKRLAALAERIHDTALDQMHKLCESLPSPSGIEVEYLVVSGSPSRAIPDAAEAAGVTLLALGTHSRKGVRRWLKGSVAEAIVRGSNLPMLVMPTGTDGVDPAEELDSMKHVVIAVDVHAAAHRVVELGVEVAMAFENAVPEITLVCAEDVQSLPSGGDDPESMAAIAEIRAALASGAAAQLNVLAEANARDGVTIHQRIVKGDAEDVIHDLVEELGASLVVVGSHGRNAAPLTDIGSTTAHVLRASNVSVLVVPSHPDHT